MRSTNTKIKVCFLADKHSLYDDRIYWKMAISLLKKGYEIHYLFIGKEEEIGITEEGVHYISLKIQKFSNNRYINYLIKYSRPKTNYDRLFEKAKELNADIYHFHDLNINKIGKKLKELPQKPVVIYDVRDPFAQNIKDYIGNESILKPMINLYANYIDSWEKRCAKYYDYVISNEENLRDDFRQVLPKEKVDVIYNYTYLHKYRKDIPKEYDLIYCGGITKYRGAFQIIKAVEILKEDFPNIKLIFLGNFFTKGFKLKMERMIQAFDLRANIVLKDSVPYNEVVDYYNKSKIGLGIFLPIKTHHIILQIKIFEYMAMGLPIVGSHFGHINNYIRREKVGLTVDPSNSMNIAEAIKKLLNDKLLYTTCSKNAIIAVEEKYHWETMEEKLFSIYDQLLADREKILMDE